MIEVKAVASKRMQREFLNFPLKLYKGNPYFVPPLYGDEKKIFSPKYVYHDQSDAAYFNAYRDGVMVGRISAILQKASNEQRGQKRVRFTRFDCIDSQETASKLFAAAEEWARDKGMDTVCGPLGFSDLEREGLLVEGFEELSTFEEQYNFEYYGRLVEGCGYVKEVDWVERKLYSPKAPDKKLREVTSYLLKRYGLRYGESKNTNDFLKKYGDKMFELLERTYKDIYQTVPFTEGMKKMLIANFRLIIDVKHVGVIVDENDRVVCFGVCFPSLAKAVQRSGGRLTPACIVRLLHAIKHPSIIDLGLVGVDPEYGNRGVSNAIITKVMDMLEEDGILYAETNLNLEDNYAIINQWKRFEAVQHKRRRSYIKTLI